MSDPDGRHGPTADSGVAEALVETSVTHAIFGLDRDGCIDTWPTSAAHLYGYESADNVGRPLSLLLASTDEPATTAADLLVSARGSSADAQSVHERADGSRFWAELALSARDNDEHGGYVAVASDQSDCHEHTRMLERQNDRLKEFTDILSHDLRSPLNVVDGRLDLYRETGDEAHLDTIAETVERMERLVDDLLRIARYGHVVTDAERLDVEEVLTLAWEGTGEAAGATLTVEEFGQIHANRDRLSELFENLFRNAVEHGGDDVTVRVGPLADGFYIEDDGNGVSAEIREQIFDHGFTTSDSGTGYGLSIVRTIVGAHGWDISMSEATGGGARLEITGIESPE